MEERILSWNDYILIQTCLKLSENRDCDNYICSKKPKLVATCIDGTEDCKERHFENTRC